MVSAVLAVPLSIGVAGSTSADPRPHTVPHQPPIAGSFKVIPDHGPAGFQVTLKGSCGFSATSVLPAFGPPPNPAAGVLYLRVRLQPSPLGQFSIVETVPFPNPPGDYLFGVVCTANDGSSVLLPHAAFEVTPDAQRGR